MTAASTVLRLTSPTLMTPTTIPNVCEGTDFMSKSIGKADRIGTDPSLPDFTLGELLVLPQSFGLREISFVGFSSSRLLICFDKSRGWSSRLLICFGKSRGWSSRLLICFGKSRSWSSRLLICFGKSRGWSSRLLICFAKSRGWSPRYSLAKT